MVSGTNHAAYPFAICLPPVTSLLLGPNILLSTLFFELNGSNIPGLNPLLNLFIHAILICVVPKYWNFAMLQRTY
jgi:hypothetical protein